MQRIEMHKMIYNSIPNKFYFLKKAFDIWIKTSTGELPIEEMNNFYTKNKNIFDKIKSNENDLKSIIKDVYGVVLLNHNEKLLDSVRHRINIIYQTLVQV